MMSKEFYTRKEVLHLLQIKEGLLFSLEKEEIICPIEKDELHGELFSSLDLERVRLAKLLVEEMDVNLAGVDIILRMRQDMIELRRQFDVILEDVAKHLEDLTRKTI